MDTEITLFWVSGKISEKITVIALSG